MRRRGGRERVNTSPWPLPPANCEAPYLSGIMCDSDNGAVMQSFDFISIIIGISCLRENADSHDEERTPRL